MATPVSFPPEKGFCLPPHFPADDGRVPRAGTPPPAVEWLDRARRRSRGARGNLQGASIPQAPAGGKPIPASGQDESATCEGGAAAVEIVVQQGNITEAAADAVIVNLFEGVTQPGGATGALDAHIGGLIRRLIANGELRGKLNETAVLHVGDGFPFRKVVVVGLGKASEFDAERVRQVSAAAAQAAPRGRVKTIATIVHGAGIGGLDVAAAAQSVAEGTLLGLYRYDKYKTRREDNGAPDEGRPERVVVVEMDAGKLPVIRAAVERGVVLAEATNFARDL